MTNPARPTKRLRIPTSPWAIAQPHQRVKEQRKSDVRSVVGHFEAAELGRCCGHEFAEAGDFTVRAGGGRFTEAASAAELRSRRQRASAARSSSATSILPILSIASI